MNAYGGHDELRDRIARVKRLQQQEARLTRQLTRVRGQLQLAVIELNLSAGLPAFPVEDQAQPDLGS